jgi:hypothetical protein
MSATARSIEKIAMTLQLVDETRRRIRLPADRSEESDAIRSRQHHALMLVEEPPRALIFARTRSAHFEHEQTKSELKGLMPEDAKEAIGHGIRAKRSKTGAVSFDLLSVGG